MRRNSLDNAGTPGGEIEKMVDPGEMKFWFSECQYDQYSRKVRISGCILSAVKVEKISIYINDQWLGDAELGIPRPDVFKKFPEYNNKNPGWMLEKDFFSRDAEEEVEARLYLAGAEHPRRFGNTFTIKNYHPPGDYAEYMEIEAIQMGTGPVTPLNREKEHVFSLITHREQRSSLVICRPFLPLKDTDTDENHYYFVDENNLDRDSISHVVKNYLYTFVEETIVEKDGSFFDSLETICLPVDDFIVTHPGEFGEPRITFLVSSDTHADFITRIAAHFKAVQYIIPGLTFKDDGAARALAEKKLEYVEIGYNDRECKELEDFAPDFIFCGADWTSEFIALSGMAKKLSIPVISLQEGPQDWHMRFLQRIHGKSVLKVPNHYRNSDVLFSQGAVTLNYIRPKYAAVTGNPKIAAIVENPLPPKPLALINCNFTYIATKPPYEDSRQWWLEDVISACKEAKIDYFISQHPRDEAKIEDPNVIKSSASVVKEQILKASIIISRFSSIPYEALAQGREAVYYNPHREPMLSFSEDIDGAVKLASDKTGLVDILREHKNAGHFDTEAVNRYLSKHCGPMDGRTFERMIALFKAFAVNRPDHKKLMENTEGKCPAFNEAVEFSPKKLNIAIFSRNSAEGYSGGRYCSFMLAEALCYAGHKVFFITEYIPNFYGDFRAIPTHQNLEICLTAAGDFHYNLPLYSIDIVFLIPGMDQFKDYYINAIAFAQAKKAHLVLLNFESPNWFNQYSPIQRDAKLWENWDLVSRYCSLILSNSAEGRQYAKRYYTQVPKTARFDYSHPSINTFAADKVLAKKIKKQKRIAIMARFTLAAHKGCFNIPDILSEDMRGYTFVIMVGTGAIPNDIYREILEKADRFGIKIEVKSRLSDYEKCVEIRKAALMLFPSFFEGYGYPPLEALYLDTPCIAFELPVLVETCGDNLIYVPRGDWSAFKEKIARVLKERKTLHTREKITKTAKFEEYAVRMDRIVSTLAGSEIPAALTAFEWGGSFRTTRPSHPPVNNRHELKAGKFLKPVSRFMKNHISYYKYERLKSIYKQFKTKEKSALKTLAALIRLFTGRKRT